MTGTLVGIESVGAAGPSDLDQTYKLGNSNIIGIESVGTVLLSELGKSCKHANSNIETIDLTLHSELDTRYKLVI